MLALLGSWDCVADWFPAIQTPPIGDVRILPGPEPGNTTDHRNEHRVGVNMVSELEETGAVEGRCLRLIACRSDRVPAP